MPTTTAPPMIFNRVEIHGSGGLNPNWVFVSVVVLLVVVIVTGAVLFRSRHRAAH